MTAFGNDKPVKTSNIEIFKPRHDGKHFFIAPNITVAQPTQADIESAIADAQTQGSIIKITSAGFSIPEALKEITSLPVTFRNQIDGWNYDITVFSMTFTPQGSKLSIGCKFNLPNNQAIYFGANDIATSGKNGFVGELPILTSTLSDAKRGELDDVGGLLGGETQFYEVSIPNFNDKLKMGLSKDTKLHFECGTFKKFTLSGYLKSFDVVERENNDGTSINDGKPLMLFFGTKEVFDWQDMYFEASVSRSFHHTNLKELGFNFSASNKVIIDLSKTQNPANLPTCVNADGWQGVYFPTFQVRLPQFFKLREGVTLASRTGKNLFIDKTGLLGNMTAEKVYALNEGYTDEVNKFDMSLDLLSANFVCNQAPVVTMLGRIQLGKCSSVSNQADKLLYYNVIYDKVRNGYSFLVKEKESGNYSSNSLTLVTGSMLNFSINGNDLVLNAKLSKTPIIATTAYNNSVCSNFETNLSISDCSTGMFKWSTTSGDENVNPLIIKPITTLTNEQIVYRANCFDKYCISENSNAITLTVYNGLPDLTLTSDKSVMCSYETATLTVGSTCAGKISWITPENASFVQDNVSNKTVNYPILSSTENKIYQVRCNLSGCVSNQTNIAIADIRIKKAPTKPLLSSDDTNKKVCSGKNIIISGSCNASDTFKWTAGLTDSDPNPFTLTTDVNNPQNKTHIFKATCTNDGCTTESDLTINEYAIPKPTHFFAVRNPIEIGGLVEVVALGCPEGSDVWSNGKAGIWNGWNGSEMKENIHETKSYSVRCVVNGCSSLPTTPITVYVESCIDIYPKPTIYHVSNDSMIAGEEIEVGIRGCPNNKFEWNNGAGVTWTRVQDMYTTKFYPTADTEYKVRCVRDAGCASTWVTAVSVKVKNCEDSYSKPTIYHVSNDNPVAGEEVEVGIRGCPNNKFEWNNGAGFTWTGVEDMYTTKFYPTADTEYKVRCVRDASCASTWVSVSFKIKIIKVIPCSNPTTSPNISSPKTSLTSDSDSITLTASSCIGTVSWSNGSNSTQISVSSTGRYYATCTVNGCVSGKSNEIAITMEGCTTPNKPAIVLSKDKVQTNESITVSASCPSGITLAWTAPSGFRGGSYTPTSNTTFKAKCVTPENCSSDEDSKMVSVSITNCSLTPSITAPSCALDGNEVTISGSCGNSNAVISWLIGRDRNTALTTHDAIIKDLHTNNYFIIDCALPNCSSQSAEHFLKRVDKPIPSLSIIGNNFKTKNDVVFVNMSNFKGFENKILGDIKQGKYYKYIAEPTPGQYSYSLIHTSECGNSDETSISINVYNSYKVFIQGKQNIFGNCKDSDDRNYLFVADIDMPNNSYFYTDPELTNKYDFKDTGRFCMEVFNNSVKQEGGRDVDFYNMTYRTINKDKVISQ